MTSIIQFLSQNGHLAKSTRTYYGQELHALVRFAGNKDIDDLSEEEVCTFLQGHDNPNSYNTILNILRRYYNFIGKKYLEHAKQRKGQPRVLDIRQEDINYLMEACLSIRDQALIAVLIECGFRAGEIVKVRICDVEFQANGGWVTIQCPGGMGTKTGPRIVPAIACTSILGQWLEVHPRRDDPYAPLFCNINERKGFTYDYDQTDKPVTVKSTHVGDPLTANYINMVFYQIEKRAKKHHPNLTLKHIHPHKCRHWAATQAVKQGCGDTETLKQLFGWKDDEMPARYIHLTNKDAINSYLRVHGIATPEAEKEQGHTTCPGCAAPNVIGTRFCKRCGRPMNLKIATEIEKKVDEGDALIEKLLSNPALLQKLRGALSPS